MTVTQTVSDGIVVIGAGYGGVRAALTLARMRATRGDLPVTLVDRGVSHQIITEIHRVAAGYLAADAATLPYAMVLRDKPVHFVQAEVSGLDLPAHRVILDGGRSLPYRYLVVALGSDVDDRGVPGVHEFSMDLRSVVGARRVWAHLQEVLHAPPQTPDFARDPVAETVVVVGAGWTGTELTGELASLAERWHGEHGLAARIILLEASATVMPGFSPALASAARDFFTGRGVDLRLQSPVKALYKDHVLLGNGATIAAGTVIWTAGVRGSDLLRGAGLTLGPSGRVYVDRFLRAQGHDDVFVVGDAAFPQADEGVRLPGPSAQLALHQGSVVAVNIGATLTRRPLMPYRPIRLGEALSLGEDDAVAMVGPVLVRGRRALALKRGISLNYVRSLTDTATALGALKRGL